MKKRVFPNWTLNGILGIGDLSQLYGEQIHHTKIFEGNNLTKSIFDGVVLVSVEENDILCFLYDRYIIIRATSNFNPESRIVITSVDVTTF